ncbi:uncharacterized protein EDB93DRAFT_1336126 [Suillus bovinus]|uniref:uncharacterized protein n=1 Tax=Suillus bovinus TaxID=48563 RepID=UPI001B874870|nr:uncharacterized protein EDB93DRAFT_1336126 [Suillus bovinus]KAG2154231.1 hypothetical protein EDB93DRAFT_1336126 [Suillus bovinus]
MQAQLAALEAKVKSLESELHSAKAHCAMALSEVGLMKKQLNKRQKKTRARNINARWLTSAEGLRQCEEQDVAREAKAQKKAEAAARKASRQASRLARQAMQGSDICFTGALSAKSKEDLIDIVNQLTIETTGTKAELLKAIREYFDSHANLKNDARFEGLFNGRSRRQKRPLQVANITENEENIPPPTNRQRINPSFPPSIESASFASHNRLYPPMQFNSSNYPSSSTIPPPLYPQASYSYYSHP